MTSSPSKLASTEHCLSECESSGGLFFTSSGEVADVIASQLCELVKRPVSPIEKAWINFLAPYEWQWFCTFTFASDVHPEAANKAFRYWVRLLDQTNGVPKTASAVSKRRAVWVRGLEWQKRNVIHYHALFTNLPVFCTQLFSRREAEQLWQKVSGGFARVDLVTARLGSLAYVCKYAAKGGEVDFSATLQVPDLLAEPTTA